MWDMDLSVLNTIVAVAVALVAIAGCTPKPTSEPPVEVSLYQQWEMQPGDTVASYTVLGGLGDLSIDTSGGKVYAPYDGRLQPHKPGCVIFSSAEVPNYLLRLCGLKQPRYGQRLAGEAIGTANTLQFALLNKRSDGLWALVEPSEQILEQMLQSR
jgi:hypothetical protein